MSSHATAPTTGPSVATQAIANMTRPMNVMAAITDNAEG